MTKTKFEILAISSIHLDDFEKVEEAMDIWAKEVAIEFVDWLDMNEPKYQKGQKYICAGELFDNPPTTEQLYELFKSKK